MDFQIKYIKYTYDAYRYLSTYGNAEKKNEYEGYIGKTNKQYDK